MSFEKPWGNYLVEKIIETPAPDAVSLWPETIAWQVIFIGLLLFALKKSYQAWKTYQANIYRREALAWLKHCSLDNESDVRQLPALLRKVALLANEVSKNSDHKTIRDSATERHHDISQLSGESWSFWLDKHCTKTHFNHNNRLYNSTKLLAELAYTPALNLNDTNYTSALHQLYQQITLWVQHHNISIDQVEIITGEQHD